MIVVDDIKVALFDFDDTLCIHTNHLDADSLDYDVAMVLHENYWKDCSPNKCMRLFLNMLDSMNVKLGLISSTHSYQHMAMKQDWVEENYGVKFTNYCTGKGDKKLRMLQAISKAYDLPPENILIVDDMVDVVSDAANAGFMACSPMEVVNLMNQED